MATVADVIQQTYRYAHLHKGLRIARLSGALTNSATTLTVEYGVAALQAGMRLSVDLEDIHVFAASTLTANPVQRGVNGSTAAAHNDDALTYVDPEVSPFEVFSAINDELASLSSPMNGLYKKATVELTWNPARQDYNLTAATSVLDILSVQHDLQDGSYNWPVIPRDQWRLKPNSETDDFASGYALSLYTSVSGDIRVVYKTGFTAVAALADDVNTVSGLPSTANDVLAIGAAIRVLSGRPVRRASSHTQGDTRRAEEVSTTDALQSVADLRRLHRERVDEEAARLKQANA